LAINVKVMHLVGLWNHHWQDKRSWRYFAYFSYAMFMVLIMTVHFVTEVLDLYFSWGDFTNFASTAWFANNYGASIIKQVFILAQTDKVRFFFTNPGSFCIGGSVEFARRNFRIRGTIPLTVRYSSGI
jgi:hypothetical protein